MNQFLDYLVGEFNNKRQAFSHPTRYAYIRILHRKISDDLIYGEQAYAFRDVRPYRQFILRPVQEGETIRVINYDIKDQLRFVKGENLDLITDEDLILRTGCDTIFTFKDNVYYGSLDGCECFVDWQGKQTYLQNKVELGLNYYNVFDKGMCVETNTQIWGSQNGFFQFIKQ
jgi:CpeT protein